MKLRCRLSFSPPVQFLHRLQFSLSRPVNFSFTIYNFPSPYTISSLPIAIFSHSPPFLLPVSVNFSTGLPLPVRSSISSSSPGTNFYFHIHWGLPPPNLYNKRSAPLIALGWSLQATLQKYKISFEDLRHSICLVKKSRKGASPFRKKIG